jgi:sigma-B regulation protein RsbU (phosphoserine phosphatase)
MGQFISAGHNTAYLFRSATGTVEELVSNATVLGLFDYVFYESSAFRLDKGDILVVYSDGLTDAQNPQEEMFGEERLLRIIRQEAPSGSQALEERFLKAIEEFTQGTPQTDDITFVVVEKCQ